VTTTLNAIGGLLAILLFGYRIYALLNAERW